MSVVASDFRKIIQLAAPFALALLVVSEAHGRSASTSFGKAEDITASVSDGKPTQRIEPNSYVVNCRD